MFTIPIIDVNNHNEEVNKFLSTNKIMEIEKQLVQTTTGTYWCIYISYVLEQNKAYFSTRKIDYKEILSDEKFKIFSKLRELRKKIAVKDNVSAYIIFTDAELAEIVKLKEPTLNNLKTIKGIGDKKIEKYGEIFITELNNNEKSK